MASSGAGDGEAVNLVDAQPKKDPSPDFATFGIVKATQYGAFDRVRDIASSDPNFDPNDRDPDGVTLLHWASINNRVNIAEFLIERGADVDAVGGDLRSAPVHWAVRQGHLPMVVLLIRHGADPDFKDAEGLNCLHLAAQLGHTAVAAYLVAKGSGVNDPDDSGMTPLMWACLKTTAQDPTKTIINLGAAADVVDERHGNTALHWAIVGKNPHAITLLIDRFDLLKVVNRNGQTPINLFQEVNREVRFSKKIEKMFASSETLETRFKELAMLLTPFLLYSLTGMTLALPLNYWTKAFAFFCLIIFNNAVNVWGFNEKTFEKVPLSIYFTMKFWFSATWLIWLYPYMGGVHTVAYLTATGLLWYSFVMAWKGDPGVIKKSRAEKMAGVVYLGKLLKDQGLPMETDDQYVSVS